MRFSWINFLKADVIREKRTAVPISEGKTERNGAEAKENSSRPEETSAPRLPLVLNTWAFKGAAEAAWKVVNGEDGKAVDGVEAGLSHCEVERCDGSVGAGSHPDENGETTLDALIMDGPSHDAGAVASLRRVKNAASVARKVLDHTEATLLVGDQATQFAKQMGFHTESLSSKDSKRNYDMWKMENCQPNFWKNVIPESTSHCGPYKPGPVKYPRDGKKPEVTETNHDTIGMIVIDKKGRMAVGASTNGADHKIPGRCGDTAIPGAGAYVDQDVGGAAATGDGDVMMRVLPTYQAVENMRQGMSPDEAAADAIRRVVKKYEHFQGALVVASVYGEFSAACHGFLTFRYAVAKPDSGVEVHEIPCL